MKPTKHILKRYLLGGSLALIGTGATQADENLWIYAKGTDTRPQGSFEFKINDISRFGKNSGDYAFHDFRPEIEYGVTDRLTLGVEPIFFHHDYSNVQWAPMVDTQGGPGGSFEKTQYGGLEIFTKYNILSPYKDFIGLSVGLGYERREAYRLDGARIDQDSLVPMLFLQKNFLDDTLQFAFAGKMEFEQRKTPGILEEEIAFDLALGASYRIAPKWFIGLESRFQSDFLSPQIDGEVEGKPSNWDLGEFQLGDQFQWGLYVGPTIHYAEQNWWATAGVLWQVKGWSADGPEASNQGKNWDEHEKMHIGFTIGFEFGEGDGGSSEGIISDIINKK
jgi:hypothetical protein